MTEKGCDNCYYTYFDERAYPCSLCIRGIERTDQWQPSKKTKADRKTENSSEKPNNCEPQTEECPFDDNIPCEWVCTEYANCKYKPQTDYKKWEAPPKVDLPTGEITTCVSVLASALEDEPTISKMEQVETMSCEECKHYGTNYPCELDFKACRYEPKTEPQTDCSWK